MKKKYGKRVLAALMGVVLALTGVSAPVSTGDGLMEAYAYTNRQGSVKATTLNVRSGPGTGHSIVKKLSYGAPVTVVGEQRASDGVLWYQIRFRSGNQDLSGYVSSQYIKFNADYSTDTNFENYLNSQGFPESYKEPLRVLHAEHPNWQFVAQHTNLDWNDVIEHESRVGANLVSKNAISSWKSTDYGAYDWDRGTWTGFDGPSWVAASREIVMYYMDPRNFLNDIYVFQFLLHTYDSRTQTKEGLNGMIRGTFLDQNVPAGGNSGNGGGSSGPGGVGPGYEGPGSTEAPIGPGYTNGPGGMGSPGPGGGPGSASIRDRNPKVTKSIRNLPVTAVPGMEYGPGMDASSITGDNTGSGSSAPSPSGSTYADIIMQAAGSSGVNPYVIAAMILQEQGKGTSGSISGKTAGYEGIYNFFNIGAYADGSMSAVTRGLWYASQHGSYMRPWNSIEKSIIGGAQYYGDNYTKRGQDTFYLKKFNVQGDNLYKHQFMTNIEGAAGEGAKLSKAYTSEMKNQPLVFKIPVFRNMPESAVPKPDKSGSPNNKLSSLTVTGYSLTPTFSKDVENYDIIVNPSVEEIEINASVLDSHASVVPPVPKRVKLNSGNNDIPIQVYAENGTMRVYNLHVVRQGGAPSVDLPPSVGPGYDHGGQVGPGYVPGPGPVNPPVPQPPVPTEPPAPQPPVPQPPAPTEPPAPQPPAPTEPPAQGGVMTGDVNGDGKLSVLDIMLIKKHIWGTKVLEGPYKSAADVNGDGKVTIVDTINLQKSILAQ